MHELLLTYMIDSIGVPDDPRVLDVPREDDKFEACSFLPFTMMHELISNTPPIVGAIVG
jgi:hypothetical protein